MTRLGSVADLPEQSTRVTPTAEKAFQGCHFDGETVDGRPAETALGDPARRVTAVDSQLHSADHSGGSVVRRQG